MIVYITSHRWQANLRILEVGEIKSLPYGPRSHPLVERLIGTIRREFLDHILVWNARDLERKLKEFQLYDNGHRVHASLRGQTPAEINGASRGKQADLDRFCWRGHCRGLVRLPLAA